MAVEREGVFKAAVEGIKAAKKAGFLVCTNTTVYKETDMAEIDALYALPDRSWAWTASCCRRPTATRRCAAPTRTARPRSS